MPGAAEIWEAFCLGPFDLIIEERKHGGDVAAAKRVVEATNDGDGSCHDDLVILG
jgi:hypothetical protein